MSKGISERLKLEEKRPTVILASIDKDLNTTPGWHYRWPVFGSAGCTYFITEDEANRNFYKQLLVGDSTDNIVGCPGIGAKNKAMGEIDKLTDIREMAELTFNLYLEHELTLHCMEPYRMVKAFAFEKYLENARLIWIRREENEIWHPPKRKEN